MKTKCYESFWEIVGDWRYYNSSLMLKLCHEDFREDAVKRLEYLQETLRSLLARASPAGRALLQGYYGVLVPGGQQDGYSEPDLHCLEKIKARAISGLDKIVRQSRIVRVP